MDVRFEDHRGFQRTAGLLALGGSALAAALPWTLPAAATGGALALATAPGVGVDARKRRLALAVVCAALAWQWAFSPAPWLAWVCGGVIGALACLARLDASREDGARPPSGGAAALTIGLSGATLFAAASLLPALAVALEQVMPGRAASALTGVALGLWAGAAAVPVHLVLGGDAVEQRLASLRASLDPALRALAERAASARRGACAELPQGARADLRAAIDALALAALDPAGRCSELGRAAAPALEDELRRRSGALLENAEAASDPAAKQSYLRAGEALGGQLEHLGKVRLARDRALARLHEEVANLERARFSLTLLRAPENASELALLEERLRCGATAFEEVAPVAAAVRVGA